MKLNRILRKAVVSTIAAVALGGLAQPAFAGWGDTPESLGVGTSVGGTYSTQCRAGGSGGTVWGSGIYSTDSSICMAAVHAGFINRATGGRVQFRVLPGQQSYAGSTNNGITTQGYGAWRGSFQIVGASRDTGGGRSIPWNQSLQGLGLNRQTGSTHSFTCPARGSIAATVWGTDVYSADSAVCVAAVHRGLISPGSGGTVRVRILSGQQAFDGSHRHGVTTRPYGPWDSSFTFR